MQKEGAPLNPTGILAPNRRSKMICRCSRCLNFAAAAGVNVFRGTVDYAKRRRSGVCVIGECILQCEIRDSD
jgi:hypothetical protein